MVAGQVVLCCCSFVVLLKSKTKETSEGNKYGIGDRSVCLFCLSESPIKRISGLVKWASDTQGLPYLTSSKHCLY